MQYQCFIIKAQAIFLNINYRIRRKNVGMLTNSGCSSYNIVSATFKKPILNLCCCMKGSRMECEKAQHDNVRMPVGCMNEGERISKIGSTHNNNIIFLLLYNFNGL